MTTFWGIFSFELRYQLRRPWPWLAFIAVFAIIYLTAKGAPVDDATYTNTWINSSFTAAMNTVLGCMVWLLVAAPIAGEAAARDASTLMHPLTYTSPVSKRDYLGGRFLAALVLNLMVISAVTGALLLASYGPGALDAFVGPFRIRAFLYPFAFLALPNVLVTTAIQFAVATFSRRPMAAYLGSIIVFLCAYVGALIVGFGLRRPDLAPLMDPIGPFLIFSDLPEGWTPAEKNNRLLLLEGTLLKNRLLWMSIATAVIALGYARFRFRHYVVGSLWRRRATVIPGEARNRQVELQIPRSARDDTVARGDIQRFDLAAQFRQTLTIASVSFRQLARMRGGLDVLVFAALLAAVVLPFNLEVAGVPIVPRTERILRTITTPLTNFATPFLLIPLLIVYWAGELVWRERDARIAEITDASPIPHWAMFGGKLLGLALMLATLMLLLMTAGIAAQAQMGQRDFDIPLYLKGLFGFQLTEYLLFAVLALVVHVVANQKYLGHLIGVMIFGLIAISGLFDVDHGLLVYGSSPGWSYTQMRGFGPTLAPWLWFKSYWAAWAVVLAVGGVLLWARGKEDGVAARLSMARRRMTPRLKVFGAMGVTAVVLIGAFVFWNTNVLHTFRTRAGDNAVRAEYERRYAKDKRAPQPAIEETTVRVELFPERQVAEVKGTYVLVNRANVPIDTVVLSPSPAVRTSAVTFDRPASLALADSVHYTHFYRLAQPLQPGDSLRMSFEVRYAPRGFTNGGVAVTVVDNGTQIKLSDWLPGIGYQPSREILGPRDRAELGLPARPVIPVLEDEAARYTFGGRTMFEAIVGTSPEEIAVAPGALQRTWTENGRKYFHYKTDAPISGEMPVLSSAYAVHEETFTSSSCTTMSSRAERGICSPVQIRINYHPAHKDIVDNVLTGVRSTLEYGTRHFGPYPYGHVTVSERSAGGMGLNAESGNIDYSEQFTMLAPERNPGGFDFAVAVIGHEMGHNFGVPIAPVEGAPVMSESFAWYTAMGVIEHAYGREQLVRMLSWMHEPYPHKPIKMGRPLIRALDPWSGYRRGPFAHYAMKEYIGEAKVNGAIRTLREKHFKPGAPAATTLDLYRELDAVTPDSMKTLLKDLFAENTFWELGVVGSAKPGQGESWEVTLEISARKFTVDTTGKETDVPMNDLVDVGVFASPRLQVPTDPLYFEKRRITSGKQTITLTVPRKPARVGLDPYLLLLDLDANDNWEAIQIKQ